MSESLLFDSSITNYFIQFYMAERYSYVKNNNTPSPAHYQIFKKQVRTGSLHPPVPLIANPIGTFGTTSKLQIIQKCSPGPGSYFLQNSTNTKSKNQFTKKQQSKQNFLSIPSISKIRKATYLDLNNGLLAIQNQSSQNPGPAFYNKQQAKDFISKRSRSALIQPQHKSRARPIVQQEIILSPIQQLIQQPPVTFQQIQQYRKQRRHQILRLLHKIQPPSLFDLQIFNKQTLTSPPGPQHYQPFKQQKSRVGGVIPLASRFQKQKQKMGPCLYENQSKSCSASFKFKKSQYADNQIVNRNPGPGSYKVENSSFSLKKLSEKKQKINNNNPFGSGVAKFKKIKKEIVQPQIDYSAKPIKQKIIRAQKLLQNVQKKAYSVSTRDYSFMTNNDFL